MIRMLYIKHVFQLFRCNRRHGTHYTYHILNQSNDMMFLYVRVLTAEVVSGHDCMIQYNTIFISVRIFISGFPFALFIFLNE